MFINYTLALSNNYTVICLVPHDFKYFEILESNNIKFEKIKIRNYYDVIASVSFIKLHRKYKPEFIFSHNGRFNSVINFSSLFSTLRNKIAICHGDTKRLSSFTRVLTVNRALEKILLERNIKNVSILPNFVEIIETSRISKKTQNNVFTFGMISRLSPEKSIIDAVKSVKKLPISKNIKYKLKIAGSGPELDMLTSYVEKENLQDIIEFCGWVSDKEKFYENIDCLVLTSLSETFGLTILEAFNYCIPVISSRTNGPEEIIDDGINGLLYDASNREQLVRLMIKVSNDPGLATKIGNNGLFTLQRKYSRKVFEDTLFHLLSSNHK